MLIWIRNRRQNQYCECLAHLFCYAGSFGSVFKNRMSHIHKMVISFKSVLNLMGSLDSKAGNYMGLLAAVLFIVSAFAMLVVGEEGTPKGSLTSIVQILLTVSGIVAIITGILLMMQNNKSVGKLSSIFIIILGIVAALAYVIVHIGGVESKLYVEILAIIAAITFFAAATSDAGIKKRNTMYVDMVLGVAEIVFLILVAMDISVSIIAGTIILIIGCWIAAELLLEAGGSEEESTIDPNRKSAKRAQKKRSKEEKDERKKQERQEKLEAVAKKEKEKEKKAKKADSHKAEKNKTDSHKEEHKHAPAVEASKEEVKEETKEVAPAVEDTKPVEEHVVEAKAEEAVKEEPKEAAPVEEEPKQAQPEPVRDEPKVEEPEPVKGEPKTEEAVAPEPEPVKEEPEPAKKEKPKNDFMSKLVSSKYASSKASREEPKPVAAEEVKEEPKEVALAVEETKLVGEPVVEAKAEELVEEEPEPVKEPAEPEEEPKQAQPEPVRDKPEVEEPEPVKGEPKTEEAVAPEPEPVKEEAKVEEPVSEPVQSAEPEPEAVPVEASAVAEVEDEEEEAPDDLFTDYSPEAVVRRAAWNRGLRCRRNYGEFNVPVAFVKGKVAVYVEEPGNEDLEAESKLKEDGWIVLRFDITKVTDGQNEGAQIAAAVKANTKAMKAAKKKKKPAKK